MRLLAIHRGEHEPPLALTFFTSSPRRSSRDSLHDDTVNPGSGESGTDCGNRLDPDAVAALRQFFELLDNWDRKETNAQPVGRKGPTPLSPAGCKPIVEPLQITSTRAQETHSRDVEKMSKTIGQSRRDSVSCELKGTEPADLRGSGFRP